MTALARMRSVVSTTRPSTPASLTRSTPSEHRPFQTRPQMQVIEGGKLHGGTQRVQHAWKWVRSKSAPMLYVVVSVVFLLLSLVGSLMLRTTMAENSFEVSQVQTSITKLQQDVETAKGDLNMLRASLPQQAQKMGMHPAQGGIVVDLQGYHE